MVSIKLQLINFLPIILDHSSFRLITILVLSTDLEWLRMVLNPCRESFVYEISIFFHNHQMIDYTLSPMMHFPESHLMPLFELTTKVIYISGDCIKCQSSINKKNENFSEMCLAEAVSRLDFLFFLYLGRSWN